MTANSLSEWVLHTSYTSWRELALAAGTRRGRALALALLLCAVLPSAFRVWMDSPAKFGALPKQQVSSIATLYGPDVVRDLAAYPSAMVSLCILTLLAIPLLAMIAGHDNIARDVANRSLRSVVLRTSSSSIVAGKFVGLWVTLGALLLLCQLLVAVVVVVIVRGPMIVPLGACFRLWLACALSSAPYAALALLISTVAGSSARSMIGGFAVIILLVFVRINRLLSPELALWLLPAQNDASLLSSNWPGVASATLRLAVWTAAALLLCVVYLKRREI